MKTRSDTLILELLYHESLLDGEWGESIRSLCRVETDAVKNQNNKY